MKSKNISWAGNVAPMGQKRNFYIDFVRKPEGKRPLRRPKRRLANNIKLSLTEIGLGDMDLFIWHRIKTSDGFLCTW
jgi:hypothetical protein